MRLSAAQLSALLEGLDWRRVHNFDKWRRVPIKCAKIVANSFLLTKTE
jgi:hypothetical protein